MNKSQRLVEALHLFFLKIQCICAFCSIYLRKQSKILDFSIFFLYIYQNQEIGGCVKQSDEYNK